LRCFDASSCTSQVAIRLASAIQSLRERAGNAETVTVPSELLEQTAKIESAQIAKERRDAVLQSIGSLKRGDTSRYDGESSLFSATPSGPSLYDESKSNTRG
jgi:hypothetical protein